MHWFPAAVLSALAFGLAGFFMKVSQMRGGALPSLLLGLYAAGTLGFWAQALLTGAWQPLDWRVWAAGAVIGLGSAWGNLLFMRALQYGPASLTSPLTNANIVIVMAAGIVWFDEPLRATALVGALWLLAGIALLSLGGRGRRSGANKTTAIAAESSPSGRPPDESAPERFVKKSLLDRRWYPLAIAATGLFVLRNGGLKVTDRLGLDSASVLWAGYLLSWLWFAAGSLRARQGGDRAAGAMDAAMRAKSETQGEAEASRDRPNASGSAARIGYRWGLAAGVFSYGGLQLYAEALARGPSHLVAPIFAANSLVVVVLSFAIYRERLTPPQYSALLCLLAGLVLIRV